MKPPYLIMALAAGALLGAAGCAPTETAQQALLGQARRAVTQIRQAETQRAQVMQDLYASRRQRLDDGFDNDVRSRPTLEAAWVIEHRQAYVAAMEAMLQQQAATGQAQETTQRDLEAIDLALQKLNWFSAIRANWTEILSTKEVKNENH